MDRTSWYASLVVGTTVGFFAVLLIGTFNYLELQLLGRVAGGTKEAAGALAFAAGSMAAVALITATTEELAYSAPKPSLKRTLALTSLGLVPIAAADFAGWAFFRDETTMDAANFQAFGVLVSATIFSIWKQAAFLRTRQGQVDAGFRYYRRPYWLWRYQKNSITRVMWSEGCQSGRRNFRAEDINPFTFKVSEKCITFVITGVYGPMIIRKDRLEGVRGNRWPYLYESAQ